MEGYHLMSETMPSMESFKLKSITDITHTIKYNDMIEFIHLVSGQEYDCLIIEEWNNDIELNYNVERTIEEYDLEAWNSFKTGDKEQEYSFHSILNGLCSEKLIPFGKYVITPN
jgi:hypothetical protein